MDNLARLILKDLFVTEKDLKIIYLFSKAHILKVADYISNTSSIQLTRLLPQVKKIPIPVQHEWNFSVGDRVKVRYPLDEFKHVQKETIGWNGKLKEIIGHTGFVLRVVSQFDNTILVMFPTIEHIALLYAGVLEKDPAVEALVASRWKVGDYVMTRKDENIATLLQQNHGGDIPKRCIGSRGRVIAVTKKRIFVTFNEQTGLHVNPALLVPTTDKSPLPSETIRNIQGFVVGEEVQITPNLKLLILNQKQIGEWDPNMNKLQGQPAVITDLNENGTVDVKVGSSKSWSINCDSLQKPGQQTADRPGTDASFRPNDMVRFNISLILPSMMIGLPPSFLKYLTSLAVVRAVDEDCNPVIQFNRVQHILVHESSFKKWTQTSVLKEIQILSQIDRLGSGDQVIFNVGPPKFVREVLTEEGVEEPVIRAMTTPARLLGFTDMTHAVLQCDDGKVVRINKKYLTIPHKTEPGERSPGEPGKNPTGTEKSGCSMM